MLRDGQQFSDLRQFILFPAKFGPHYLGPFFIRGDAAERVSRQYFAEQSRDSFFRNLKLVPRIYNGDSRSVVIIVFVFVDPLNEAQDKMKRVCTS